MACGLSGLARCLALTERWSEMHWKTFVCQVVAALALVATMSSDALAAMPLFEETESDVATLLGVKGSVKIAVGVRSIGGTEGMRLNIGDRVLTLKRSAVEIWFDDGCRYTLNENEGLTISEESPCCALTAEEVGATLIRISGGAMVSKGAQYVDAFAGMRAENGERVMALSRSSVDLQYDDGCRYVLEENELLTIEDDSPCCLAGMLLQEKAAAVAAGDGSGLAIIPPAAAALIGVVGATLDTGGDGDRRPPPISQ